MNITPEIVRELLDYNPTTGAFVWRERGRHWLESEKSFKWWNSRYSGKPAGTISARNGYRWVSIRILGHSHLAHRLAWAWMKGEPPEDDIDHANRDSADNRWCNIRASSPERNMRNLSRAANNTTGVTGVTWCRPSRKWRAEITLSGKTRHLGFFGSFLDAVAARKSAEREHGFDSGHGRPRPTEPAA